jgi:hypothetical protein
MQVASLVKEPHLNGIPASASSIADVQGLVEVLDEVDQELDGLLLLCLSRPRVQEYPMEALDLADDAPAASASFNTCSKKTLKRLQVNLAEIRNSTEVRLVGGSEHSKRYILDRPFLDLPRRKHPDAVSVNQYLRHHSGVVGRLAAIVLFVRGLYRREIELIHNVADEIDQMVFRKPVT